MSVNLSQANRLDEGAQPETVTRLALPPITPRGCLQPVSDTLPTAVERIIQVLRPRQIILFGSYAYGVPTPDSDVDLLVIMETDRPSSERSWAVVTALAAS